MTAQAITALHRFALAPIFIAADTTRRHRGGQRRTRQLRRGVERELLDDPDAYRGIKFGRLDSRPPRCWCRRNELIA